MIGGVRILNLFWQSANAWFYSKSSKTTMLQALTFIYNSDPDPAIRFANSELNPYPTLKLANKQKYSIFFT